MALKNIALASFIFTAFLVSCGTQNNKTNSPAPEQQEKSAGLSNFDSTVQLMEENRFWELIEKSRSTSLKSTLLEIEPADIERFDNTFTALLASSYDYKLWGAAYVINGGCSDDCFEYFREYLIGCGKDRFYQTVQDPESCASWIKSEETESWEGSRYTIMDIYKLKTGKEIPKTFQPKYVLRGTPFDEETVHEQYPKLAKKFMANY